jgi:hypothetical protein
MSACAGIRRLGTGVLSLRNLGRLRYTACEELAEVAERDLRIIILLMCSEALYVSWIFRFENMKEGSKKYGQNAGTNQPVGFGYGAGR